jgi:glycosyltransferase involved in cell wall biosynthesis
MPAKLQVLAIEPYYGGSHRAFLHGLAERSRHRFQMLTQPARFWKWRMRGSAIRLAERMARSRFEPDVILATDMLSLAEFLAMYRRKVPAVLYMHENQLVFPTRVQDERDVHFGFTNITSCLAASRVVWNSSYHMESFLEAAYDLLRKMPDERPEGVAASIRERSVVIPPGIDLAAIDAVDIKRQDPPVILWNHRWEHDKRPELFFEAMERLDRMELDFRIAVLGESFDEQPEVFVTARRSLKDRIATFGYVKDVDEYHRWLGRSAISVSTADQENFGISAVEAAYAGARPLWPDRLSYPELMPGRDHLYRDMDELVDRLSDLIETGFDAGVYRRHVRELGRYGWDEVIGRYDDLLADVAG